MNPLFDTLRPNQRRGSKPRCHLLTQGAPEVVASRLTKLITPWGRVSADDHWMPSGFDGREEAQLHNAPRLFRDASVGNTLQSWWLAVTGGNTTPPNWDIASTCVIGDRPGLLLVEAKAHAAELRNEEKGKVLGLNASANSNLNHLRIGACIEEAGAGLTKATGLTWNLSRDKCYQMANRFAWSWKLVSIGIPVTLVHLGFTGCNEIAKGSQRPITNDADWRQLVLDHSSAMFPDEVWDTMFPDKVWDAQWTVGDQFLITTIRTASVNLHGA
jgi:hypothetical protein